MPKSAIPEERLDIASLHVVYGPPTRAVHALKGVSLRLPKRRILGVVGESGSGKSTLALAAMGATDSAAVVGEVRFAGQDILALSEAGKRQLWGNRLAMVFQDPGSTLNPVMRVGKQVTDVLCRHQGCSRAEATHRLGEIFQAVQFADPGSIALRYPHELSGGQKQRVSIAIAVACNPDVLFLDEPTTGLDVTTEARILELIVSLRDRFGTSIMLISHNLGVIAQVCDEVAVMYAGEIVEHGAVHDVLSLPRHPYTAALLDCLPRIDLPAGAVRHLSVMTGSLPRTTELPSHCQFAPRCPIVQHECQTSHPALEEAGSQHYARCLYWHDVSAAAGPQPPRVATEAVARNVTVAPLLQAGGLTQDYSTEARSLSALLRRPRIRVLDHVGLEVWPSETLGVVGESGSGKTTMAKILVGLLQPTKGEVRIAGALLPKRPSGWSHGIRKRIQMVFQNPDMTLNPGHTVFETIARPLERFGITPRPDRRARTGQLLDAVRLDRRYLDAFPSQLSGGERQRVAIARALACNPDIVVCDEPTSALDVSVQAAVLNLLVELQSERRVSYLFISHDLSVIRHIADRVIVLYRGTVLEVGVTADVFAPPFHPYTEALLSAVPTVWGTKRGRIWLDGLAPQLPGGSTGCVFHQRCPRKLGAICEQQAPPLHITARNHRIACHIPLADLATIQTAAAPDAPVI